MEYKRLTKKTDKGYIIEPWIEIYPDSDLGKVVNRLAEYEDAEEAGLLVRLPCKLGDTVYCLCTGNYTLVGKKTGWNYDIKEFKFTLGIFATWKYGEKLFLTREEAEKKLKELQNA